MKEININKLDHPHGNLKSFIFKLIKNIIQRTITIFTRIFANLENDDQILISSATHAPWLYDKKFFFFYKKIKHLTLLDEPRAYTLWQISRNLRNINASILDIGCLLGGSGFILSKVNKNGEVRMYDSFQGFKKDDGLHKKETFYFDDINFVKKKINELKLKKTFIEKTYFPKNLKKKIYKVKICHIDVNTYSDTMKSFSWIDKKIIKNGVIIFDDFGIWGVNGVKRFIYSLEKSRSKDYIFIKNYFGQCILIKK
tara:strand:+ start:905 stop:1669 length:765 start_codon:yes stop_codon:yes gene_type:complete